MAASGMSLLSLACPCTLCAGDWGDGLFVDRVFLGERIAPGCCRRQTIGRVHHQYRVRAGLCFSGLPCSIWRLISATPLPVCCCSVSSTKQVPVDDRLLWFGTRSNAAQRFQCWSVIEGLAIVPVRGQVFDEYRARISYPPMG